MRRREWEENGPKVRAIKAQIQQRQIDHPDAYALGRGRKLLAKRAFDELRAERKIVGYLQMKDGESFECCIQGIDFWVSVVIGAHRRVLRVSVISAGSLQTYQEDRPENITIPARKETSCEDIKREFMKILTRLRLAEAT